MPPTAHKPTAPLKNALSEVDVFSAARGYGLSQGETEKLVAAQLARHGRLPTLTEVAITGALWSEHCSYKSSKIHIKKLHFAEDWVITASGENAGAVDIGDGQAVVFKMESHNHPSYLEPFHGAATGVGGILRDIFTMGAKPIANVNALRFGVVKPPHGSGTNDPADTKMKNLVKGVVHGIGHYGNCVGVPMVMGEAEFLPAYNGNILVNAMTVGLADRGGMASAVARGVGNWVVYLGSKTGRDGVKGAVMASQEFSGAGDEAAKPAVQVGDPFAEKLLMDLCLKLIKEKKFIAIQDMGAAGLSSSSAEMADKGGVGIELDLDLVPLRQAAMEPQDIMLSESQERMLAIIDPSHFDYIKKTFGQHHLDCEKIGAVVMADAALGSSLVVKAGGAVVADLATNLLVGQAPLYDRPQTSAAPLPILARRAGGGIGVDAAAKTMADYLERYFASSFGADKSFIYEQYDRLVQGNTILTSGQASAAVVRVPPAGDGTASEKSSHKDSHKALAISCHGDPLLCQADPALGGRAIILETYRKLCAVGARPLAYTNNLNFGNPENPAVMAGFATLLQAMGDVSRQLHFPTISGNVSLYNQTAGRDIYHTPVIGGVGLVADYRRAVGSLAPVGARGLWLVEPLGGGQTLAASRYEFLQQGAITHRPSPDDSDKIFNIDSEYKVGQVIREMIEKGIITACSAVGAAGLLVDGIKMCLAADMTVTPDPALVDEAMKGDPTEFFFGIGGGRYLVCGPDDDRGWGAGHEGVVIKKFASLTPSDKDGGKGGGRLLFGGKDIISWGQVKTLRQKLSQTIYS